MLFAGIFISFLHSPAEKSCNWTVVNIICLIVCRDFPRMGCRLDLSSLVNRQDWMYLDQFLFDSVLSRISVVLGLVSLTQMLLFSRRFVLQPVLLVSSELVVGRAVTVRTAPSVMQRPVNVAVLLAGREPSAPTVSLLHRYFILAFNLSYTRYL